MRWFEGDVSAAIAESRRVGALFVVYITGGKDNEEKHMSSLWDAVDVDKDLPWRAVAVRLHEGSDDARLFAQIYPTPAFPITYFIDMNGKPTNVVLFNKIESMDTAKFREALPKLVFPIAGKEAGSGLTRVDGSAPPAAAATPAAAPAPIPAAATVPTPAAPAAATTDAAAPSTSSAAEIAEKIRRAKELVEKKKAAEEERKRKEELARETQRREDAKEAHRLSEERRNKELLDAAAARRKDKLDSAKERERVKEQIKADKAEREARFRAQQQSSAAVAAGEGDEAEPAQQQPPRGIAAPLPVASDRCRIQLRFPDGSTALHDFPAGDTLASLRQIVAADARVRGSPFRLAQPAPRRIYKEEEMETSFLDLALTPASTLLVLTDSTFSSSPAGRAASAVSAAVQPAYNPMTTLVGFMTYLIWTPIQYVLGLVGMGGAAARGAAAEKKDDPPASTSASSQPATANAAAAAAARRRHQGGSSNIHTLGAAADSSAEQSAEDDADGNWNGNSTQYL